MNTNWFGWPIHPTDSMLHWSLKSKERGELAKKYRKCYDAIKAAGLEKELECLISAAYGEGSNDMRDQYAEED